MIPGILGFETLGEACGIGCKAANRQIIKDLHATMHHTMQGPTCIPMLDLVKTC